MRPTRNQLRQSNRWLKQTAEASEEFFRQATNLSQIVDLIVDSLCHMPGKNEIEVQSEIFKLRFVRSGNFWTVLVEDQHEETVVELKLTGVMVKAKTFPLLLKLITDFEVKNREDAAEIAEALNLLRGEPLATAIAKKGAR